MNSAQTYVSVTYFLVLVPAAVCWSAEMFKMQDCLLVTYNCRCAQPVVNSHYSTKDGINGFIRVEN